MQYTITFKKSSVENGRTLLHETTICETDMTNLKRQVSKIAKEIEPFAELQKASPQKWESYGYRATQSWNKFWSPYTHGYPLKGDESYSISIIRTSGLLETVTDKVHRAGLAVDKAREELLKDTHAFNPDISKLDPELDDIITKELPPKVKALRELINSVEKRIRDKVIELNSMGDNPPPLDD